MLGQIKNDYFTKTKMHHLLNTTIPFWVYVRKPSFISCLFFLQNTPILHKNYTFHHV